MKKKSKQPAQQNSLACKDKKLHNRVQSQFIRFNNSLLDQSFLHTSSDDEYETCSNEMSETIAQLKFCYSLTSMDSTLEYEEEPPKMSQTRHQFNISDFSLQIKLRHYDQLKEELQQILHNKTRVELVQSVRPQVLL